MSRVAIREMAIIGLASIEWATVDVNCRAW
jgi:hypothetical protein